jgi:hypothetical protein
LPRGRNDRCGYALVYQAVRHALRDLSPLSATAVVGISERVAQRPGLIGCAWANSRSQLGDTKHRVVPDRALSYRPLHADEGQRGGGEAGQRVQKARLDCARLCPPLLSGVRSQSWIDRRRGRSMNTCRLAVPSLCDPVQRAFCRHHSALTGCQSRAAI